MNECVAIDAVCITGGVGSDPNTQLWAVIPAAEINKTSFRIESLRRKPPWACNGSRRVFFAETAISIKRIDLF